MIRISVVLVIIGFVILSCNNQNNNPIVYMEKSADTVSPGDVFEANLFLKYKGSIHIADFFVVQGNDTFLLDYNAEKKCAVFKATTYRAGDKKYQGYVEFENEEGVVLTENFIIEFYTK